MSNINATIYQLTDNAKKVIMDVLKYVGEMSVNEARTNGDYIDQTGNLRSSIGYIIVNDGVKVIENLQPAYKGSDRNTGVSKAQEFINKLILKYNRGIVLIVVAGMNYATLVETRRNVLASARLLAIRETPRLLIGAGFNKIAA